MMDGMMKMMKESGAKKLKPLEKEAKLNVLKEFIKELEGMMGEKLNGAKKVTVASNTEEGLEKGLDKAKDLIGEQSSEDEVGNEEDESMDEMAESDEESESGDSKVRHDQLKKMLKEKMGSKF